MRIGKVTITVELPDSPEGYSDSIQYSVRPDGVTETVEVHDGYHHFSQAEINGFVAEGIEAVSARPPFSATHS